MFKLFSIIQTQWNNETTVKLVSSKYWFLPSPLAFLWFILINLKYWWTNRVVFTKPIDADSHDQQLATMVENVWCYCMRVWLPNIVGVPDSTLMKYILATRVQTSINIPFAAQYQYVDCGVDVEQSPFTSALKILFLLGDIQEHTYRYWEGNAKVMDAQFVAGTIPSLKEDMGVHLLSSGYLQPTTNTGHQKCWVKWVQVNFDNKMSNLPPDHTSLDGLAELDGVDHIE